MRLFSWPAWALVAPLASLVVAADVTTASPGAGVVEVDVIFPRNQTYAPTNDTVPVVFAIQNPALASYVNVEIGFYIVHESDVDKWPPPSLVAWDHWLKWATISPDEPYYFSNFFSQTYEIKAASGRFRLVWDVYWYNCSFFDADGSLWNDTRAAERYVDFAIQSGGRPMDLVAATASGEPCGPEFGVAINVTSQTVAVPAARQASWGGNGTCHVLAEDGPTPTADPCRVQVSSAVVASMSASREAEMCAARGDCGRKSSAAQPLAVASVAGLAAVFGAVGFFLMQI